MKKRDYIILALLLIICCLISKFSYNAVVKPHINEFVAVEYMEATNETKFPINIKRKNNIVQHFKYSLSQKPSPLKTKNLWVEKDTTEDIIQANAKAFWYRFSPFM